MSGNGGDGKASAPSGLGPKAPYVPPFPLPPMGKPPSGMLPPRPGALLRKESLGVPKVKTHKELLKGMYARKGAPPPAVPESESSSGEPSSFFVGSAVPSDKCFEPVPWTEYFDDKAQVRVSRGEEGEMSFNLYTAGTSGPLVLCLHGGGYTGLSWAPVARQLKDNYRVAALDLRSHGESSSSSDMSIGALAGDVAAVWTELYGAEPPPTVLVGHSMGGAVAIHAACALQDQGVSSIEGVVVLDVVEGTALSSLPYMQSVISRRPSTFASPSEAVRWALQTGATRSLESARVSFPSQLAPNGAAGEYAWVTDLAATSSYWDGWYRGLSEAFLHVRAPKLLMLAGTDRLDKALSIAQMQGKFQLKVLQTGHAMHEDEPGQVAQAVGDFANRFIQ